MARGGPSGTGGPGEGADADTPALGGVEIRGHLDEALMRAPLVLGCEPMPLFVLLGLVVFVTVVVIGISPAGLLVGAAMVVAGVVALRKVAERDPQRFAVLVEASRYPRVLHDVLPDTTLPRELPFAGFDDPPTQGKVATARLAVAAIAATVGAAVGLAVLAVAVVAYRYGLFG